MVEQIPLRKTEAENRKFFLGLPETDPAKLGTKKLLRRRNESVAPPRFMV